MCQPHKIKKVVYLTAMVPQSGQSAIQLVDPVSLVGPNLIINEAEGWVLVNEEAIPSTYYNQCSPEDVAFAKPAGAWPDPPGTGVTHKPEHETLALFPGVSA